MSIRTHVLALAIAATMSMTSTWAQTPEQDSLPPGTDTPEPGADSSQPLQQNTPADASAPDAATADSSAAPAASIDDQKIKQFASAYAEVATIQQNASNQLQAASEPAKQQEVKANAESQMIAAVERNGLNVDEFNQIVTAMASDENVRSRVAAQLQERSPSGTPQ